MKDELTTLEKTIAKEYPYGFSTAIATDVIPKGLNEQVIRLLSAKKEEPEWMLEWRLKAYRHWLTKNKGKLNNLDEVDPELLRTFEKLGISLNEQKRLSGVAIDVVVDSISVATSFKEQLSAIGIIFCSISEAVQQHPELIKKYLGSVVPATDNFFAALNAAVFTDGSFCYIPAGVRCPMELSTYFRINTENSGQFERTLIIAEEGSYVSYWKAVPLRSAMKISYTQLLSN
jgi:Fe-S cluster assembly protein SufB